MHFRKIQFVTICCFLRFNSNLGNDADESSSNNSPSSRNSRNNTNLSSDTLLDTQVFIYGLGFIWSGVPYLVQYIYFAKIHMIWAALMDLIYVLRNYSSDLMCANGFYLFNSPVLICYGGCPNGFHLFTSVIQKMQTPKLNHSGQHDHQVWQLKTRFEMLP